MISVNVSAIASLTRTGMLTSPSPGNSITIAPMRANTSMKAAARAGRSETSMRMVVEDCASATDDSRRYPQHMAVQRVRHERQRQYQGDENRQDFRHEYQRLLLNLGKRLHQRHRHADHQTDRHQRRRHQHNGPDRIAGNVERFSTGHLASLLATIRG